MYIKFDYFYFPAFDFELKVTEILKCILPFFMLRAREKLPSSKKILVAKIIPPHGRVKSCDFFFFVHRFFFFVHRWPKMPFKVMHRKEVTHSNCS